MKKLKGVGLVGAAAGALWMVLRYERELWARADRVPPTAPDPHTGPSCLSRAPKRVRR